MVIGVVVVWALVRHSPHAALKPPQEHSRDLRVIELPAVEVAPRVIGYGTTRPARVWRAVSEVGGRVLELHPALDAGEFLQAGEVALRIDSRDYQLAVKQVQAELTEVSARIAELTTQFENDQRSLTIEKTSLALVEAEFQRVKRLAEAGNAADTELRDAERRYLSQKQSAQALENAIRLNQKKRETAEASRDVTEARLARARRDVEKTWVRAPFACRLQEVKLEVDQFVQAGQQLFEADGIDAIQIDVQIPVAEARKLAANANLPKDWTPSIAAARDALKLSAVVRTHVRGIELNWNARFVRIREQLEPVTRTVQFVVAVDDPYKGIQPGVRPPLLRGVYCEVELRAPPLTPHVVVPRASVFDGGVYVLDPDSRLRRREIESSFEQSDFVCVERGLEAGVQLVISDPRPAIEGQLVRAHLAGDVQRQLIAQATGAAATK
ncbi:MAG: HlyD family efflux transporter periplasmic adaptor subunit [Phycisphaerae bacterium]|nr:HlyD family efflux transporter periplasmic adaptor subunit [Phycisphaerae bacterium]